MTETTSIRNILIVGGGTAGWMAATYLATQMRASGGRVTLVESKNVPIIGVGEATVPPLVGFLRVLGISEAEFMRRAHATYKLGIKFINWHDGNESFWHPFGPVGGTIDGMQLFHFWLKSQQSGHAEGPYTSYSIQALLAEQGKAPRPIASSSFVYDRGQYAYHLDAARFAEFLSEEGMRRGAVRIVDDVTEVRTDERGFIEQVITREHGALKADLYIDCSGFRALLSEQALGDRYIDWSDTLLCDRALAAPLPHADAGTIAPYTKSTALSAGWAWQIPLTQRVGNGYVYCSRFIDDESAARELAGFLGADPGRFEPRPVSMRVGRRERFWRGNCIAMGLSSGFVEPLESTGIFIIQRGLALLLSYFPDTSFAPHLAERYNERMAATYEEIRDFILLHYVLTRRTDTDFWKTYRDIPLPESLRTLMEVYDETGLVEPVEHAMFPEASWYCIFAGQNRLPRTYHRGADLTEFEKARHIMGVIKNTHDRLAATFPTHREFVARVNEGQDLGQPPQLESLPDQR